MSNIILSIAPIFALLVLGQILLWLRIPDEAFWKSADRLVYWIMIPALLFTKLSVVEFGDSLVGPFAVTLLAGFFVSVAAALVASRGLHLAGPAASSVLQGAARHNIFIALAVAESLYGASGLTLAALAAAVLIPVTNVTIVPLMVTLAAERRDRSVLRAIARDLARNPLLLAVLAGLAVNAVTDGPVPVLTATTAVLGAAGLPLMLLCIGASLRIKQIAPALAPLLAALTIKFAVFPVVVWIAAAAFGLSAEETMVAMIFATVPTASSAFSMAGQLGGDAPMMAGIMTIQTLLAFAAMPILLGIAQRLLGV